MAVPTTRWQLLRNLVVLFLPIIAYAIGDYLVDHWDKARQLEEALGPYAFSTSLLVGLVAGLVQFGWHYHKTRKLSSYVLQQLAWLLAFTVIPLHFGHFVKLAPDDPVGYNVLGLVGVGLAGVYFLDYLTGGRLMLAFPRHFSPEMAEKLHLPNARRVLANIELAMVSMFALKGLFLIYGNRLLPKATYLLVMPFVAKGLLAAFLAFVFTYTTAVRRRVERAKAAADVVPSGPEGGVLDAVGQVQG